MNLRQLVAMSGPLVLRHYADEIVAVVEAAKTVTNRYRAAYKEISGIDATPNGMHELNEALAKLVHS